MMVCQSDLELRLCWCMYMTFLLNRVTACFSSVELSGWVVDIISRMFSNWLTA